MYIVICERRRRGRDVWQINLTDGGRVTRRTYHLSATVALIRVRSHLAVGHVPAARSAVRDLWRATVAELAARDDRQLSAPNRPLAAD